MGLGTVSEAHLLLSPPEPPPPIEPKDRGDIPPGPVGMLWFMQEAMTYGTHIVLDGFRADPQALGDSDMVREVLEGLGRTLESETEAYIQVFGFDNGPSPGSSGAAILQELGLALHLFPDASKLTLRVFSRHNVRLGEVAALLSSRYGVGRFETQIRNRSRPIPREKRMLRRVLCGDRTYARLRLEDFLRMA